MKKILISFGIIILIIALSGIFNFNLTKDDIIIDDGGVISWEKAIVILNSGQVDTVAQLHDLSITIELKNGINIYTKEPRIDLIFDEVKKCGEVCNNIGLITE